MKLISIQFAENLCRITWDSQQKPSMEQYQIMLNEKKNKNGYKLVTIEKHKVKLVTKRYPQAYGVD